MPPENDYKTTEVFAVIDGERVSLQANKPITATVEFQCTKPLVLREGEITLSGTQTREAKRFWRKLRRRMWILYKLVEMQLRLGRKKIWLPKGYSLESEDKGAIGG